MSTVRIYSKVAFAIGEGATRDGGIDQFITVPRSFQDMPEKYVTDKTFKSAVSAGLIIPYYDKQAATPVVEDTFDDEDKQQTENEKLIAEFKADLKTKNHAEVKELAEKYNAEYVESEKLGENKKRVFEAFKLSLNSEQ
nr:MAG TPA: hypothetical protein [Caudoviricetes sp.]